MAIYKQEISKDKEKRLLEISKETLEMVKGKLSNRRNRVLAVRPTGFGKSYMLAGLTTSKDEDGNLKYKKCLYIYPTDVIKEDVIRTYASDTKFNESAKRYGWTNTARKHDNRIGMLNDNTDFYSYNYLTNRANDVANGDMKKKDMREFIKQYDLIMLDECHRVGAEGFQDAFELFESCIGSDTHLVGVTATPDRYDEENIKKVFGEKNQIESFTLKDAIREGLLEKFDYIYVPSESESYMQSCIDEVSKLREQYGNSKLHYHEIGELKKEAGRNGVVKALKENLKLPIKDGETEEHVGKSNYAKFVVFMNNRQQIHSESEMVVNWFKQAYPTMNIRVNIIITKVKTDTEYKINGEVIEIVDTTELSNLDMEDNTIDIIFCVDKLNMGYHVESITGVILMGNTESAIKYNQQIGRCFSVRSMNKPIIIDVVSEFINNPSIAKVDVSLKGKKVDLPALLDKTCVDMKDYTLSLSEKANKLIKQDYNNVDKVIWLYTYRHMSSIDICKTLNIKLDTIVKILFNNGVKLVDKKNILEHKDLLSEELIKYIESGGNK